MGGGDRERYGAILQKVRDRRGGANECSSCITGACGQLYLVPEADDKSRLILFSFVQHMCKGACKMSEMFHRQAESRDEAAASFLFRPSHAVEEAAHAHQSCALLGMRRKETCR